MKGLRCSILLVVCVIVEAARMDPDQLIRYFGTNSAAEAPEFEIIYPVISANNYRTMAATRGVIATEKMTITVQAFGETFQMMVHQDSSFIADGLEVVYVGTCSKSLPERKAVRRDCYYRGKLVGDEWSLVSVSACSGITVFIRRGSETFHIVPLDEKDAVEMSLLDSHSGAPHIIYKGATWEDWIGSCDFVDEDGTDYQADLTIHPPDFEGLSQRYIETMVVGDGALYEIRGANTANSLLALMNSVSHVLALPSLIGDKLQLVVVDMRVYTNNTGDLVTDEHAYWTLFNFCKWQNKTNPAMEQNPRHFDIATLLTGFNIYGSHGDGTKGIALTGGACQRTKQCSLVEFLEQNAIYATAHEIGHSLGMHHDGHHGNTCPEAGFLMCPYMQDNEAELGWSICSRNYLLNFLDTKGSCLEDKPGINLLPEIEK
ncbi:A disintegrin and metalloproteinase with thrombospondin motifs 6-like [Acanthaster planci]|uniref:A disintegrin and metalloproteinase with thrombospondin motifs 6-like n=1 Tax=Acanthaster planci TaxID=133434 RepID=A0A8B7ZD04_ACAPL|nr:A disintegrin and metalloproteinase with thrombospondin motifs 6-like [Acanthaster planci]